MSAAADADEILKLVGGYQLRITSLDKLETVADDELASGSVQRMTVARCRDAVSRDYVKDRYHDLTYYAVLEKKRGRSVVVRPAFATLEKRSVAGQDVLYIDVLCAAPRTGKAMLEAVTVFAKTKGYNALMLSSLAYVVGFYASQGFRLASFPGAAATAPVRLAQEQLGELRFASDKEFDFAFKVGYALSLAGGDPAALTRSLNDYFKGEHTFSLEANGEITAYYANGKESEADTKTVAAAKYDPGPYIGLVEAVATLRKAGLSVHDEQPPAGSRHAIARDEEGDRAVAGVEDGFTMFKGLGDLPTRGGTSRTRRSVKKGRSARTRRRGGGRRARLRRTPKLSAHQGSRR